jgi:alkylation response protein AidB-like acyl-CoA dehydrogenase
MDEELIEIRDAAKKALSGGFSRDALKAADWASTETLRDVWDVAVQAGWTGLIIKEDEGGVGLGMIAASVVAEELGASLAPGPWRESLVLASTLPLAPEMIAELAAGEARVALAFCETQGDISIALVDHAREATHFLAVFEGGPGETLLRLIPASEAREVVDRQPLDPATPLAQVALFVGSGSPVAFSARSFDAFRLFAAAELVGVARGAIDLALEYARTRVQFGAPIGSFQSIKHMLSDVAMARDAAAYAVRRAAQSWDAVEKSAAMDCLAAYELAARAALDAAATAIQVHGAIGVSWEHDVHLYFKRARAIVAAFQHRLAPRVSLIDELLNIEELAA